MDITANVWKIKILYPVWKLICKDWDDVKVSEFAVHFLFFVPSPGAKRRPRAKGANIDRRLVPYDAKCKRIQSRIKIIYIYTYLYASTASSCAGSENLALVNSLQQKLIWLRNKPETVFTALFFQKEIYYFWGRKNVTLKTRLHCIIMDKEQTE